MGKSTVNDDDFPSGPDLHGSFGYFPARFSGLNPMSLPSPDQKKTPACHLPPPRRVHFSIADPEKCSVETAEATLVQLAMCSAHLQLRQQNADATWRDESMVYPLVI